MNFCPQCHNMLYWKTNTPSDLNKSSIIQYCKNCPFEDDSSKSFVLRKQIVSSLKTFEHLVNPNTKYDPTIPRKNNILCPNADCSTNQDLGAGTNGTKESYQLKSKTVDDEKMDKEKKEREILCICYDEPNMKHFFLCASCDCTWEVK